MIKLLIVDDSALVRTMLTAIINEDKRFNLLGFAENGEKAITQNQLLHPDVIIMDVNMPVMDGITATSKIMETSETKPAIIIFTTEDTASIGFKILNRTKGAQEVIKKPDLAIMTPQMLENFLDKVYLIAENYKNKQEQKHSDSLLQTSILNEWQKAKAAEKSVTLTDKSFEPRKFKALLIGASTGGPAALHEVLKNLGRDFPLPVFITQHIDKQFDVHFVKWLEESTGFPCHIAAEKTDILPGHAYIAPSDYHLTFAKDSISGNFSIVLNDDPPVHFLKPAVDKMFMSGAEILGKYALCVLLTGMGRDGAAGCLQLKNSGAFTLAESEESCVVYGMPKAAVDMGGICVSLELEEIADYLRNMVLLKPKKEQEN